MLFHMNTDKLPPPLPHFQLKSCILSDTYVSIYCTFKSLTIPQTQLENLRSSPQKLNWAASEVDSDRGERTGGRIPVRGSPHWRCTMQLCNEMQPRDRKRRDGLQRRTHPRKTNLRDHPQKVTEFAFSAALPSLQNSSSSPARPSDGSNFSKLRKLRVLSHVVLSAPKKVSSTPFTAKT